MGAIYLIRHGQASFGKRNYDTLSSTGTQQAKILGASLAHRIPNVDYVVTGSMKRHKQTAEHCLREMHQNSDPDENSDWDEYDHQDIIQCYNPKYKSHARMMADMALTLKPRKAFQSMFAKAIDRWMSGEFDAEYRESWVDFEQRRVNSLSTLIKKLGPSKTALVFTSGGPIAAICQQLMNIPTSNIFQLNWTLANCGVTKVIYSPRGTYLSSLNEHSAFEGTHQKLITYR